MDFAKRADDWSKIGGLMFRGVTNVEHRLVPKIGRPDTRKDRPYSEQLEAETLSRFKAGARPYLEHPPQNKLEWLVLAQHHGLPTRLLDWTSSLFVAAYFAVEQMGVQGDAAIYAAQIPKVVVTTASDDEFLWGQGVTAIYPPGISGRIAVQRALLTYHSNPVEEYGPERLEKVVIAKEYCGSFKGFLANIGISRGTLFPGLDGLCDDLRWELKWQWRTNEELESGQNSAD